MMKTEVKTKVIAVVRKGFHFQDLQVNGMVVASITGIVKVQDSLSLQYPTTVVISSQEGILIGMFHVQKVMWRIS